MPPPVQITLLRVEVLPIPGGRIDLHALGEAITTRLFPGSQFSVRSLGPLYARLELAIPTAEATTHTIDAISDAITNAFPGDICAINPIV